MQGTRNAICQAYSRAPARLRALARDGRESKRRTVETGGKQRVIEKRAPGMWVTFNLLQREKTWRRKNIDNWKVFSFASKPEMRGDGPGPVFDKVFFTPSPALFFSLIHNVKFSFSPFPAFDHYRSRIGNQINFPATRGFGVFRTLRLFSTIRNGRQLSTALLVLLAIPQSTEGMMG